MWRQTHLNPGETTTDLRLLDIEFGLPKPDDQQHPFHRFLQMVACELADVFATGSETFYQQFCLDSERWRALILRNTQKEDPADVPFLSSVQTHNDGSSGEMNQEQEGAAIVETICTAPGKETAKVHFAEDIPLESSPTTDRPSDRGFSLADNPEGALPQTAPTDGMGAHDSSVGEAMRDDVTQEGVSKNAATTHVRTTQWAAMPLAEAQVASLDSIPPSQLANKSPTGTKESADAGVVRDGSMPAAVVGNVATTPVATSHKTAIPFGVAQPATLEFTQQDCPSNWALSETNNLEVRIRKDFAVDVTHETGTPAEVPKNVVLTPITTIQQIAPPHSLAAATVVDSPNTNSAMNNGIPNRVTHSNVTRNTEMTPSETMQRIARLPAMPEGPDADLRPRDRPSDSDELPALTKGQIHRIASRDLTLTLTDQDATKSAEPGRISQGKGNDRHPLRNEVAKLAMDVNSGFRVQVASLSQDGTSEKQGSSGAPLKRSSRLGRGHVLTTAGTSCHTADVRRAPVVSGADVHTQDAWTDTENDLFFEGIVKTGLTSQRDPKWKMIANSIPSRPPESVRKRLRHFFVEHKLRGKYQEYCNRKDTSRKSPTGTLASMKRPGKHDNVAEPATRMADKTKTVERGRGPWTDEENDIFFNAIICKNPTKKPDEAWNEVADCFPALNRYAVKARLRAYLSGNAFLKLKYKEFCERRDIGCIQGTHAKSTKNPGEDSDEEEQCRKPAAVTTTEDCNPVEKGTEPQKRTHSTSSSPTGCSERMNWRMGLYIKNGKRARRSRVESDEEEQSWEPAAVTTTEEYKHTKKGTEPRKHSTHSSSSSLAECSRPINRINCPTEASHMLGDTTTTDAPVVERTSKRGSARCPRVDTTVENHVRRSAGASHRRATTGLLSGTTDSGPLNPPETERRYEENRLRTTRNRIQRLLLDRRMILGRDRNLHDNLCRELEAEIERIERKLLQLYLMWEREDARAIQYDS